MTDHERVQEVRLLREQARRGASGIDIARALRARHETDQFLVYQLVIDAFGMGLRDARAYEWLLPEERDGTVEGINADWTPYLRHSDGWPNRIFRLESQEQDGAHFLVTLRLFEYADADQDEAVFVDWGDGRHSETRIAGLPLSHRYEQPGVVALQCQIPGVGWELKHTLELKPSMYKGTAMSIFRAPW